MCRPLRTPPEPEPLLELLALELRGPGSNLHMLDDILGYVKSELGKYGDMPKQGLEYRPPPFPNPFSNHPLRLASPLGMVLSVWVTPSSVSPSHVPLHPSGPEADLPDSLDQSRWWCPSPVVKVAIEVHMHNLDPRIPSTY